MINKSAAWHRTKTALYWLAPSILGILLYANTLKNGYTYDDVEVIQNNPLIQDPGGWGEILASNYWGGKANCGLYRPATTLSFKVLRALFGPSPMPQHAANMLLHGANAGLALALLRIMTGPAASFLGALLFAAHPVHVEAVAPCVGRSELLAFGLAGVALLLHLKRQWTPISLVAGILAFFSKEHALALIPVLFIYHGLRGGQEIRTRWRELLGFALAGVVFVGCRTAVFAHLTQDLSFPAYQLEFIDNPLVRATLGQRFAACMAILGRTVKLLVLPLSLCSNYSTSSMVSEASFLSLNALLGMAVHVSLSISLWILARRRSPLVLAPLVYLGFLFPVSNLLKLIGTPMAERLLYLPSLGAVGLLALGFVKIPSPWGRRVGISAGILLLGFYSFKTPARNAQWRSNLDLFRADVRVCPDSLKLHGALGKTLLQAGRAQEAESELLEAIRVNPKASSAYNQLSLIAFMQKRYRSALDYLEKAKATGSDADDQKLLDFNFGRIYLQIREYGEAEACLKRALEIMPSPEVHVALAQALAGQGKMDEALFHKQEAERFAPAKQQPPVDRIEIGK